MATDPAATGPGGRSPTAGSLGSTEWVDHQDPLPDIPILGIHNRVALAVLVRPTVLVGMYGLAFLVRNRYGRN